jgi:hypothetical protein
VGEIEWIEGLRPSDLKVQFVSNGKSQMTVETLIGALSQSEKLLAMELIWQDLSRNAADLVSPNWHDTVVNQRLDNPMPGDSLNLEDAFREIQGWRDAGKPSS